MPNQIYKQSIPVATTATGYRVLFRGEGRTLWDVPLTEIDTRRSGPVAVDVPTVLAINDSWFAANPPKPWIANDPKTPATAAGFVWTKWNGVAVGTQYLLVADPQGHDVFWVEAADTGYSISGPDSMTDFGPHFGWKITLNLAGAARGRMIKGLRARNPATGPVSQAEFDALKAKTVFVLERAWNMTFEGRSYRLSPFFWGHMDPNRWHPNLSWPWPVAPFTTDIFAASNMHPNAVLD